MFEPESCGEGHFACADGNGVTHYLCESLIAVRCLLRHLLSSSVLERALSLGL